MEVKSSAVCQSLFIVQKDGLGADKPNPAKRTIVLYAILNGNSTMCHLVKYGVSFFIA